MAEFTPTEEEIEAAARALYRHETQNVEPPAPYEAGGPWVSDCRTEARAALTAVYPLLVQRICNEIDGRVGKFQHIKNSRVYGEYGSGWRDGTSNARSLVRDYAKGATKNE